MSLTKRITLFLEMAEPREKHRRTTYYHGTPKTLSARGILRSGIKPPDLSARTGSLRLLRPRDGKVYLTDQLRYAVIYAIGADAFGVKLPDSIIKDEPFGYVFLVPGSELKNIEPDEDSIGELLSVQLRGDAKGFDYLEELAHMVLRKTDLESQYPEAFVGYEGVLHAVEDGDYVAHAIIGREIVKYLEDWMIYDILERGDDYLPSGVHVANSGKVKTSECWRIDKRRNEELKSDVSNFYKIAEKFPWRGPI